jgi:hypothetical protein
MVLRRLLCFVMPGNRHVEFLLQSRSPVVGLPTRLLVVEPPLGKSASFLLSFPSLLNMNLLHLMFLCEDVLHFESLPLSHVLGLGCPGVSPFVE